MSSDRLGVNINRIDASAQFPLGAEFRDPDTGYVYRYLKAGGVIAQGDLIQEAASATPFDGVTASTVTTPASTYPGIGVHHLATSLASGECFWSLKEGVLVDVAKLESATVAPGNPVRRSGTTAGRVDICAAADITGVIGHCLVDGGSNLGTVRYYCK